MKAILLFTTAVFAALIFSACSDRSKDVVAVAGGTVPNLIDSIKDTGLRKEVMHDSIEVIAVLHDTMFGRDVEHVLFLDYHIRHDVSNPDILYRRQRDGNYPLPDSIALLANPLPTLKGSYQSVFSFRGHYVVTDISDDSKETTSEVIISDSAILWHFMMPDLLLYHSGADSGSYFRFVARHNTQDFDTIEVKKADKNFTLWKWSRQNMEVPYLLRLPIDNARLLPKLVERNTLGEDGTMAVPLDQINYDSLWHTR
ncbi:MAG: hypothetical protein JWO03_3566 [Bacteroidetes bacterium]|nr:hypothetical protein [Bacteroidota bacterium]